MIEFVRQVIGEALAGLLLPEQHATMDILVRQLWQISLLILLLAAVGRWIGRRRPHVAYLLWLVVAVKCVTPPVWSSPMGIFSWSQALATLPGNESTEGLSSPALVASAPAHATGNLDGLPATAGVNTVEVAAVDSSSPSSEVAVVAGRGWTNHAWLFWLWAIGALGLAGYVGSTWWRCLRVVRDGTCATGEVAELFAELIKPSTSSRSAGHCKVMLRIVDASLGPAVIGCWRPVIVVPRSLVESLDRGQMKAILAHELAHVRRGDGWAAWLQVVMVGLWWFHPLVWYANRQIVEWREAACDEEVVARTKILPRAYSEAVLKVLESRHERLPAMQVGMANGSGIQRRLLRLMAQSQFQPRTPRWAWVAALGLAMAIVPGATLELRGQSARDASSPQVGAAGNPTAGDDATAQVADESAQLGDRREQASNDSDAFVVGVFRVGEGASSDAQNPPNDPRTFRKRMLVRAISPVSEGVAKPVAGAKLTVYRFRRTDDRSEEQLVGRFTGVADEQGNFELPIQEFQLDAKDPVLRDKFFVWGVGGNSTQTAGEWRVHLFDGKVELVENGAIRLVGSGPDDADRKVNGRLVSLKEKTNDQPLLVSLPFSANSVVRAGRVLDADENPVVGATVELVGLNGAGGGSSFFSVPEDLQQQQTTGSDGRWDLGEFAKSAKLRVRVSTSGHDKLGVIVINSFDEQSDIVLPSSQAAQVQVVDAATGRPIVRADVSARQLGTSRTVSAGSSGTTDLQGRTTIGVAGKMILTAARPLENTLHNFSWTSREIDAGTGTRTFEVKLRNQATAKITVVDDATGNPIPYVPVNCDRSRDEHQLINTRSRAQGVNVLAVVTGRTTFAFDHSMLYFKGLEVANPMSEPVNLRSGEEFAYTFRLRPATKLKPPIAADQLESFPQSHQQAVKQLRELGAIVISNGTGDAARCAVTLSQHWQGTVEDLRLLTDLHRLLEIYVMAYPVPESLRASRPQPQAPAATDAWLEAFARCKDLASLQCSQSRITDLGLTHLSACNRLERLTLFGSLVNGRGLESLPKSLRDIQITGPMNDSGMTDLSAATNLLSLHLFSSGGKPIRVPKLPEQLQVLGLTLTNDSDWESINRLQKLQVLALRGSGLDDDVVPRLNRMKLRALTLAGTSISEAGLAQLRQADSNRRVIVTQTRPKVQPKRLLFPEEVERGMMMDAMEGPRR